MYSYYNRPIMKIGRKRHKLNVENTAMSCGIALIKDLPTNKWIKDAIKATDEVTVINSFKNILNDIKIKNKKSFLVLSDTNNGGIENCNILEKICETKTSFVKNPNTMNKIKTFIY